MYYVYNMRGGRFHYVEVLESFSITVFFSNALRFASASDADAVAKRLSKTTHHRWKVGP